MQRTLSKGMTVKVVNEVGKLFDGLVTNDQNLPFQQNLSKFNIKIFVLNSPSHKLQDLLPRVEKLNEISKEDD